MTHFNEVLNELIEKIVQLYFENVFSEQTSRVVHVSDSDFTIEDWTVAGAHFDLARQPVLKLPRQEPSRLWSSVSFDLNDKTVNVGVIVYVHDGYVTAIELFAPLHDLPEQITSFDLNPERF
jgi:hypothetical protein